MVVAFPPTACLKRNSASNTSPKASGSGIFNVSKSLGYSRGFGNTGPLFSSIITSIPITFGTTRISEKIIPASRGNLWSGCKVTSAESNGLSQTSKKLHLLLTSLNSGRYLPAYLIAQIGRWSSFSLLNTRRRLSLIIGGNSTD